MTTYQTLRKYADVLSCLDGEERRRLRQLLCDAANEEQRRTQEFEVAINRLEIAVAEQAHASKAAQARVRELKEDAIRQQEVTQKVRRELEAALSPNSCQSGVAFGFNADGDWYSERCHFNAIPKPAYELETAHPTPTPF